MKTLVALGIALALVACKKDKKAEEAPKPVATVTTGTVNADGVRTVAIEASEKGYVPERIPGKPGEKLKLVFTRTVEGECLSQLKTPDGKLVDLPMNKPVEVDVTVPAEGQVDFACGMDMVHGVVVAEKG
jgi:plastocyanin domain-containing protein